VITGIDNQSRLIICKRSMGTRDTVEP